MKIFLINPPNATTVIREGRCTNRSNEWSFLMPPITLAYCAAIIRNINSNIKVFIKDYIAENHDIDKLKQDIINIQPDIIIATCATVTIESDLKIMKIIKESNKNIKLGLIGIHATVFADEILKSNPEINFIIRGEPEDTIAELTLSFINQYDSKNIRGLSFRYNDKIVHNPDRNVKDNLDSLPYPAWDLLNMTHYRLPITHERLFIIIPSRGCSYNCIFCNVKSFYGKKIRYRNPQKVVDEMEYLINQFHASQIYFWTELFTFDKQFVLQLCQEIIKRKLNIKWDCNSRVDTIDEEMLKMMKLAGCRMIAFGVESGNQDILRLSQKGITLEQIEQAINLTKKIGLLVSIHVMFGLPYETKKTMEDTFNFVKKLNADFAQFYCTVPFPGSDLYQLALNKHWLTSCNWSQFEHDQYIMKFNDITPEVVMSMRKKAFLTFYLQPKRIFVILKQITKPIYLFYLFQDALHFLLWV